jgi:hypothetical protein
VKTTRIFPQRYPKGLHTRYEDGKERRLILSWTVGAVGVEEHIVAKQSLDSLQNLVTSTLGYGTSVTGIASFPCELFGDFLDTDQQHGQPGVGFGDFRAGL